MQITHIPVHPNFLLTWLSSSPIFTWYSTHQQYLLSMSSPNLFMPIYTCYVCIDEALLDYADFWYRVVWKPWIYLKCHHAFTNAPFPSREEDGGNQLHKPLPPWSSLLLRPPANVPSVEANVEARTHSCTHWKLLWARSTNGLGWVGSNWGNQGISMSQLPPWCQGSSPHSSWQPLPRRVILGIAEAWLWIPEQISGWGVNLVLVNTSVPKLATWCQLCGRGQCVHFGRTCVYWRWWH